MKMAGINFYAPVPRVRSESLPACPRPRDNGESLVRIDGLDARIRYAASYRAAGIACASQGCWVREGVVPLLQQALGLLPEDYSLLIFDAYRPLAVQQALYEEYSALVRRSHPEYTPEQLAAAVDDFVALPHPNTARPAPHATGGALDLTLCYRGRPLPMGTEFDDFTNLAQTAYFETNGMAGEAEAFRNTRRLLYNMMTAAGFVNYSEEWWHYSYGDRLWARTFGKTPIYGLCDEKNVE